MGVLLILCKHIERSYKMSENSASRKMLSLVLLAAGAAGMVIALILDFSGSGNTMRGPLLIIGAIAFLAL